MKSRKRKEQHKGKEKTNEVMLSWKKEYFYCFSILVEVVFKKHHAIFPLFYVTKKRVAKLQIGSNGNTLVWSKNSSTKENSGTKATSYIFLTVVWKIDFLKKSLRKHFNFGLIFKRYILKFFLPLNCSFRQGCVKHF